MARLLDWPRGLGKISYQRLSGPRTAGSSSSESLTGYVQTVASVFGAWRYQIALPAIHRRLLRLYRGMVTGWHGGANAVRVPFDDPDVISFADAGIVDIPEVQTHPEVSFSNGEPFSNGCDWGVSRPQVAVAQDAAKGDTVIYLEDDYWGYDLIGGEWLAFMPLHFGKYEVTERIAAGNIG